MTRINSLYGSQTSPVVLCMQNSVISTRNTSLHGSQTSPVVLCMQTNVIILRITSLYESQTSPMFFFAFKTATLAQKLQVSMGPALICGFVHHNSNVMTRINSLYRSQTSPVVLCMQINVISIRNTSLYGSQRSSVVFAYKTATFGSELQVSMGPRLRLLICECKTACLGPE